MLVAADKHEILAREAVASDLETIRTTTSAPEIVACARRHLNNLAVQEAAHEALAAIWPGFFSCSNALRRALQEAEDKRRLVSSPLILVPVSLEEMADGSAYLAATFGVSGVVGVVIQGKSNPELAAQHCGIFRIQTREVTGKPAPIKAAAVPDETPEPMPELF